MAKLNGILAGLVASIARQGLVTTGRKTAHRGGVRHTPMRKFLNPQGRRGKSRRKGK